MAHMIDFSNNRANIAYVGDTPWHGLGSRLAPDQSLDVWLESAGLNWEAKRAAAHFYDEGELVKADNEIIYRSDTKASLGVVTDRYKLVQPREVIEFYSDLVATQGWHLDVAGSLDGGKRIWALAKTDAEIAVLGTVDRVETYLLLATSYDGTMATIGKFSSCRVVCANTLAMSLNDKLAKVSVPHSATFDPERVKEGLGIYADVAKQFEETANVLAKRKLKDSEAMKLIIQVLAGKDVDPEDISTRSANVIQGVFDLYKGAGKGSTLVTAEGTAWGAVNAVTEYFTHQAGRNTNNRMRSAWFGKGEQAGLTAVEEALKLCA